MTINHIKTSNGFRVEASGTDAVWLLNFISGGHNKRRQRVTPQVVEAIQCAVAAGMSLAEAGKTVGLSKTTAWKIVREVYPETKALKTPAIGSRSIPACSNSAARAGVAAMLLSAPAAPFC
jgi:hypothetical protein